MPLRPNRPISKALVGLAATWFTVVILSYYAVHKPLSALQIGAAGRLALTVFGWLCLLALANLLGWLVLRTVAAFGAAERLALQIGLGLGLISFGMLALGLMSALSPLFLWLLLLVPLPAALYRIRKDGRGLRRPSFGWLTAFAGLGLALILVRSLAPPTAWDSLVYHLTGPKLYQEAGRIHHEIDLAYLGFPKAGAMLYLLAIETGGGALAQLIHATFFVLIAFLTPGLIRRAAPKRGGLAVAILIAVPTAALLAGWAYVEWIAAFGVLASYTLIRASDPGKIDRALIWAGFFAALSLNSKYTSAWPVIGLGLVVLLQGSPFKRWAAFVISTAGFVAPFLLANWVLTGNPVYPFFFDGVFWDEHRAFWFSRFGTGLGVPGLLAAPWEATIWGIEGGFYANHAAFGATIGPLMLALIPLTALRLALDRSERRGSVRDLVAVAGAAYVGWLLQLSLSNLLVQSRLLFPALPFFAALAAVGFDTVGQIGRWGKSIRFVIGGLVAFVLALTATSMALNTIQADFLRTVLGAESESAYLARRLGYHFTVMERINGLDEQAKVRFLWEPRSYYCEPATRCEADALLDRWWHDRQHLSSAEQMLAKWSGEGITHVLLNRTGMEAVRAEGFDPFEPGDWEALDQFLQKLIPVGSFGEAYTLYELPASPQP